MSLLFVQLQSGSLQAPSGPKGGERAGQPREEGAPSVLEHRPQRPRGSRKHATATRPNEAAKPVCNGGASPGCMQAPLEIGDSGKVGLANSSRRQGMCSICGPRSSHTQSKESASQLYLRWGVEFRSPGFEGSRSRRRPALYAAPDRSQVRRGSSPSLCVAALCRGRERPPDAVS